MKNENADASWKTSSGEHLSALAICLFSSAPSSVASAQTMLSFSSEIPKTSLGRSLSTTILVCIGLAPTSALEQLAFHDPRLLQLLQQSPTVRHLGACGLNARQVFCLR